MKRCHIGARNLEFELEADALRLPLTRARDVGDKDGEMIQVNHIREEFRLRARGEFDRGGTQDIPRLPAAGPIFPCRAKPAGIVKAAGPDSHHIGTRGG